MKIVCLGGGPAGVYLAISMKLRNPKHEITVYERNKPDDTFGWGVVFSDQTMENLQENDPISAQAIIDELVHWDYIDVHLRGQVERSGGHGFIGIGRRRMLEILYNRARDLGVELIFQHEFEVESIHTEFGDADLMIRLGLLGTSPHSDLAGHALGFTCGVALGLPCGWAHWQRLPNRTQAGLQLLSLCTVMAAWRLALNTVP